MMSKTGFKEPKFKVGDEVNIRGTNVIATIDELSPLYGKAWYLMRGMGGYYSESELKKNTR